MRAVVLVIASLVLASCGRTNAPAQDYSDDAVMMNTRAPVAGSAQRSAQETPEIPATVTAPMIAYDYVDTIWAPAGRIKALMDAHQKACAAAGPANCQVIASGRSGADGGVTEAVLSLRASPAWIARLRGGLDADAKTAGGRVTDSQVTSEVPDPLHRRRRGPSARPDHPARPPAEAVGRTPRQAVRTA